ncbi:N-acetylmuramoyl-L-alanine amidase [Kitasatospora sp. MMS16-BH015]|uniref:hypothetical protein n=1 Tax=Kitasatospora sp. MMS16-BH015 TaxID=2018025 RepID=UPI000CA259B0|nr:hypothetical protein [Kitasatospora sp. MMS16-BH015]AUG79316.1 N-acetylmuramoyl-L-alanine amidase [Kitasatospora sp. MMS16-BH015]
MSHRRLTATAALCAAGLALIPAVGHAADHGADPTFVQAPAPAGDLAAARSAALDTFESPAAKSHRVAQALPKGVVKSRVAATGQTIYVSPRDCQYGVGTGTAASPFCSVQHGVDAAQSGDTVQVEGGNLRESVTVHTSGLTILGLGNAGVFATDAQAGKPALTLDGANDVTLRNLSLVSAGAPALKVVGSARTTMDSGVANATDADAITVDGTSKDVSVTRTYAVAGRTVGDKLTGLATVRVAAGASGITLSADALVDGGVVATGVQGLAVAGNTVQRGCAPAVDLDGASTGVSLRNNLFVDSGPVENSLGNKAACLAGGQSWDPSVRVSADAAAGTTADTNTFYFQPGNDTAPYAFGGTTYPTLADVQAKTGQAVHDTVDTVAPRSTVVRGMYGGQDLALQKGSTAIGTADQSAPGQLDTDFYGTKPRTSRGAVEYLSTDPGLAIGLKITNTSARGVQAATTLVSKNSDFIGYVVDWGDGQKSYGAISPTSGRIDPHTYDKPGHYTVTVTATPNYTGDQVTNSVDITTAGSHYTAYGPTRLLDTRNGTGARLGKVGPFSTVRIKVAGQGGVPADAVAAALNVTATGTEQGGFITAYPVGKDRPGTSNVNYVAGQTVPNLTITPIGQDGEVEFYNGSRGSVDLVADITGYFTRSFSSAYTATSPGRLVDTRIGVGTAKGSVRGGGSFTVQIAGNRVGPLPASGVTAVALNVTVTGPQNSGYLTVFPDGGSTPTASNLNYSPGQTVANAVIAPVGADGKIKIYNGSWGSADVVVDVIGYYSPTGVSAYLPVTPFRWLDTRSWGHGPLKTSGDYYIYSRFGDPGDTGFVLNTTVTNTTGGGYLTVSPDPNYIDAYKNKYASWPNRPLVSTLNWNRGQTVPNLVQATPGPGGIVDFWNTGNGTTDLVVDVFGFYTV